MSLFKKFVQKFTGKSEEETPEVNTPEVAIPVEVVKPLETFVPKELPKDDIWTQPIVREIKDSDWDELSAELLQSDLGRELTNQLIEAGKKSKDKPLAAIKEKLESAMSKKDRSTKSGIILIVGVNGTGKTTSAAKLANKLPGTTVLAAADTFRAAAVEQVATWAKRAGAKLVGPKTEGQDPASVAFEAVETAIADKADIVIIDTAGRLQNKQDLMNELAKIRRVVEKNVQIGRAHV